MTRRTSTLLGPDGAPIVHHRAGAGPAADEIRHEAAVLALARGPGVVDLVATGDDADGGAWLSTRYVAGGTLTDLLRSAGEPAATAALARVGGTLASLHDRGIVHGRCTADHVVGSATGASLCGFSAASVVGTGRPPDALVDRRTFATLVSATLTSDAETSRRARRAVAGLTSPSSGTNLRAVAAELWALARDAGWVEPGHGAGRPGPRRGGRGEADRSARSPLAPRRLRPGTIDVATARPIDTPARPEQPLPGTRRAASERRPRLELDPPFSTDGEAPPAPLVPDGGPTRPEAGTHGAEPANDRASGEGGDGSLAPRVPSAGRTRPEAGVNGAEPADDPASGGAADRSPTPRVPSPGPTRPEAGLDGAEPADDPASGEGADESRAPLVPGRSPLGRRPLRRGPRPGQRGRSRHAASPRWFGAGGPGRLAIAGAATAASLAVLAGVLLLGDRGPDPQQAATTAAPARSTPGPPRAGSTPVPPPPPVERSPAPARVWPRPTEAGQHGAPEPAPPTAGADRPVAGPAAPVVEHAGARYAIGLPGDLVVLGDWDCDGITTPAVVRPADGSVWSFPTWTTGSEPLAAEPISQVPAAVDASTRSDTDGCDVLAITTADGHEVVVQPDAISHGS